MRFNHVLAVSLLAACATNSDPGPGGDDDDLGGGKADDGSVPYYVATSGKAQAVDGVDATVYDISRDTNERINASAKDASYGALFGTALKIAPKTLAAILESDDALENLIAGAAGYLNDGGIVTSMKLDKLTRGDLVSNIVGTDAAAMTSGFMKDTFQSELEPIVAAMLTSPSAIVYHWSGSPQDDWSTDGWVTINPTTGVIKILVQDGDG